jgi:mevalonate kinase
MPHKKYPAKVLLVGEFTVLQGGDALAVPIENYFGEWIQNKNPDSRLLSLIPHLEDLNFIQHPRLRQDFESGWQLSSNIPTGYGIGSSGVLSAAILDRYGVDMSSSMTETKSRLAGIENAFHNKSSGLDPLISFIGKGILQKNNTLTAFDPSELLASNLSGWYLLDSKSDRGHIIPIHWFFEEFKSEPFRDKVTELNQINSNLITSFFTHELDTDSIRRISELEWKYFSPLIAPPIRDIWYEGLRSEKYYLKLCGKGGGGFYLVYQNNSFQPLPFDVQKLEFAAILP